MSEQNHAFVELRGKNIFYHSILVDVTKPTIILLHDSLGCVQLWRDFPQKLSEQTKMNVLVYDRIGYGKSDPMDTSVRTLQYMEVEADILLELIDVLQIRQPILLGHSDGGSIALIAAGKYSNKIQAVVVEAAHIFVEDITLKGISDAKKSYQTTNLKEKLRKYHGQNVELLFEAWTQTWLSDWFKAWNIEHFLPNIICPLLFIQGTNDEYGTMSQLDKTIAQVSGHAADFILEKIGHTPHKEAPEVTLEAISNWIHRL